MLTRIGTSLQQRTTAIKCVKQDQLQLLCSGTVRAIPVKEAKEAISKEGFLVLDIRPKWEREKARVKDSLHVPLFVEDTDMGPVTLLKKWVHFGYIGAWTGQNFTTINERFMEDVAEVVRDKDDKLLVVCGEGLRSLMALKNLHRGGYKNLGWLVGGFNKCKDSDFECVEGTTRLQYATIGGASYLLLQVLLFLGVVGNE